MAFLIQSPEIVFILSDSQSGVGLANSRIEEWQIMHEEE